MLKWNCVLKYGSLEGPLKKSFYKLIAKNSKIKTYQNVYFMEKLHRSF